jgi:hypothetical protein
MIYTKKGQGTRLDLGYPGTHLDKEKEENNRQLGRTSSAVEANSRQTSVLLSSHLPPLSQSRMTPLTETG